jgi:hypothetical protein
MSQPRSRHSVNHVGVATLDEPRDHIDHLIDVLSRPAYQCGPFDPHQVRVPKEFVLVVSRDIPGRLPLTTRRNLDLVVTRVGVGLKVADVGDVHYVLDGVAEQPERASENVFKNVRPEVADVGVVINRRSAAIHPNARWVDWQERFNPARSRIENPQSHRRSSRQGALLTIQCVTCKGERDIMAALDLLMG